MRGRKEHSGGSVGTTDQTPPDLYGNAALLQFALLNAGKDQKSLSGGPGGEAPWDFHT
jgi:hypothetical protein